MNFTKNVTRLAVVASTLAFSSVSFAGILANGSFGFNSTGGSTTYTGAGLISTATTVSIPVPNASTNCGTLGAICEQITSIDPTYLGSPNDFAAGGHTPLAVNNDITFNSYTFDLSFATLPVFSFTLETVPVNRFTFNATSASKFGSDLPGGGSFLNVTYIGVFSDALGQYDPQGASLSLTFNQTGGATGAVTYAGTFATPPAPGSGTPEPATMAMLGSALVVLGVAGRKKLARR
jgi:PEP-CTERM motif